MGLLANLRSLPRHALLLLLTGLLLRIAFIAVHQRPLISDEKDHHSHAVTLSNTAEYGHNGVPTAYRPIAYPVLVAVVYSIVGEYPLVVKILQAFIDILTALLLYHIFGKEFGRMQTTVLALWCFYLPAVLYTNFLLTETIFTFMVVACCYAVTQSKLESTKAALLVGVIAGVLTLMKPGMALFLVFLVMMMSASRISLTRYKFVLVGALLIISPWIARNYIVLGKPTIGTNGGINLLIGNNPHATGGYSISYPEDVLKTSTNEMEADELAYRYAVNYILEHPGRFILNGVKKLAHLVSSEGGLLVLTFHETPVDFSERFASKYASIPVPLVLLVNINYMVISILGVLGLLSAPRNLLWWFVIALLSCWVATHFIFFGGSRYHFPLMPFLAAYTAFVMPNITQSFRELTSARKSIFVVIVLSLISVWATEFSIVYNAQ